MILLVMSFTEFHFEITQEPTESLALTDNIALILSTQQFSRMEQGLIIAVHNEILIAY